MRTMRVWLIVLGVCPILGGQAWGLEEVGKEELGAIGGARRCEGTNSDCTYEIRGPIPSNQGCFAKGGTYVKQYAANYSVCETSDAPPPDGCHNTKTLHTGWYNVWNSPGCPGSPDDWCSAGASVKGCGGTTYKSCGP